MGEDTLFYSSIFPSVWNSDWSWVVAHHVLVKWMNWWIDRCSMKNGLDWRDSRVVAIWDGQLLMMMIAWTRMVFVVMVIEGGQHMLSRGIYKVTDGIWWSTGYRRQGRVINVKYGTSLSGFCSWSNDGAILWEKRIEEGLILREKS